MVTAPPQSAEYMDSQSLINELHELALLPRDDGVETELAQLQQSFSDARRLSRELLDRDYLTPYQANKLLKGNGNQLAIGPYRVLERLGEGGAALVFKARHYQINRTVAVKLIRSERVANPVAVERFLREYEASAGLSHPHVVRAYDAGEAGDGFFIAMQFIDGIDLSALVKKSGPLPIFQAGDFVLQAARGLQHIHDNGMVHRDIKPGNLMVTEAESPDTSASLIAEQVFGGPWGLVKILDLGIARLAEDPNAPNQRAQLTKLGSVMGTPDYMSPEQALHGSNADIRSDIYSLGCTFYYLLAGQPPFPGDDALEKMLKHQLDEPRPIEEVRKETPLNIRLILRKMMAKKPEERYQTPRELVDELEEITRDRPAIAKPAKADVFRPLEIADDEDHDEAPPAALPVASGFADEFDYEDTDADSVLVGERVAKLHADQQEWKQLILISSIAVAAGLLLVITMIMLFR